MTLPSALSGLAFHALLHLLAIGTLVRLAVAVALSSGAVARWAAAHPRSRYSIAVAGFVAAIVLPLALQSAAIRHGSGADMVRHDEPAAAEAAGWSGRSGEWPLLPPAASDYEAWWRWLSIGPFSSYLSTIWLLGILLLSAGSAAGWWRFRRQRRRWVDPPVGLRRTLGLPAAVPLAVGRGGTPLATGLWRPRVYLPLWSLTDLDPAALARIARHELAHVRWRDPLVDRGVRILRGLFWPAWPLWSLSRVIRREREAAADSEALSPETMRGEASQAAVGYAETLLAVAARRRGLVPQVGAAGELEDRVRRLLHPAARAPAWGRALPAALLLAGSAALVVSPLPAGSAALAGVPQGGEDVRTWGPLDHFLGFNPRVELVIAPGVRRLRIQGQELDAAAIERWLRATSLEEKAAMVREAEAAARRAPPGD